MKRLVNLLLAVFLLAGCSLTNPSDQPTSLAGDETPVGEVALYTDPSQPVEVRVEDLLSRMTLEEKIGQMTQPENYSVTPAEVKTFFLGSVLSGGGSISDDNSLRDWTDLVRSYQDQALQTRLGIPILYGVELGAWFRACQWGDHISAECRPGGNA